MKPNENVQFLKQIVTADRKGILYKMQCKIYWGMWTEPLLTISKVGLHLSKVIHSSIGGSQIYYERFPENQCHYQWKASGIA